MLLVNMLRVFDHGLVGHPLAIFVPLEETTVTASVASNGRIVTLLGYLKQDHVLVAIESHFMHLLDVAGLFTFVPKALSGAAPVHSLPQRQGARQCLAVHPCEHEDITCAHFLCNDGHQP